MSKTLRAIGLIVLVLVGTAHRAEAGSWWEYIDRLSGPGPFFALTRASIPVSPPYRKDVPKIELERGDFYVEGLDARRLYGVVEIANWDAQANAKFPDEINLWAIQAVAYVPLEPKLKLRGVDVGAGFGIFWFKGAGVTRNSKPGKNPSDPATGSFVTPVVPLRLKFTPSEVLRTVGHHKLPARARKVLSLLQYSLGAVYVPGTFDNTHFYSPVLFKTHEHLLFTHGFVLDLTGLLFNVPKK